MDWNVVQLAFAPAAGAAIGWAGARTARSWAVDYGAPAEAPGSSHAIEPDAPGAPGQPGQPSEFGQTGELGEPGGPADVGEPLVFLVACSVVGLGIVGGAIWAFPDWRQAVAILLGGAFLFSAIIDLRVRLLPDWTTLLAGLAGAVLAIAHKGWPGLAEALLGALSVSLMLTAVSWWFRLRIGRVALGAGDIKLGAALGALIGPIDVWLVLSAAAALTVAIAAVWALVRKRPLRGLEMPFGAALLVCGWVGWLAQALSIRVPLL